MASAQKPPRRAFTLIEAAIVLAIVGVVIGGIWVAASSVNQNIKINRLAEIIISCVTKTRDLYNESDYPVLGAVTSVENVLAATNAIPNDLYRGGYAYTPFGGVFFVALGNFSTKQIHFGIAGNNAVANGINKSQCEMLIRKLIPMVGNNGIAIIFVDPGVVLNPPFPTSGISCPSSINNLQFEFSPVR